MKKRNKKNINVGEARRRRRQRKYIEILKGTQNKKRKKN